MKKNIKCPYCGNQIEIEDERGDKKYITCPICNKKGVYTFKDISSLKEDFDENSIITVKKLTKTYSDKKAVDNISFSVKKGEIFGFLGPNGAGKTTTIKSILGLIKADSGEIEINGFNIRKSEKNAKKNIGYLPEKVAFYDNLTALQNLLFYAKIKKVSKEECLLLLEEFGLGDVINKKVGKFSKGMVQRLGMIRAIMGNPPILILDEPSSGLDPRGAIQIRNKIREMNQNGATVFVSSHILSEIQEICDRVGIINKGVLVAKDTVEALSKKLNLKPKLSIELEKISDEITKSINNIKGIDKVEVKEKTINVICDSETKAKVILAIAKAGGNILNLQTQEPSLEEVFIRYTGGEV